VGRHDDKDREHLTRGDWTVAASLTYGQYSGKLSRRAEPKDPSSCRGRGQLAYVLFNDTEHIETAAGVDAENWIVSLCQVDLDIDDLSRMFADVLASPSVLPGSATRFDRTT